MTAKEMKRLKGIKVEFLPMSLHMCYIRLLHENLMLY